MLSSPFSCSDAMSGRFKSWSIDLLPDDSSSIDLSTDVRVRLVTSLRVLSQESEEKPAKM